MSDRQANRQTDSDAGQWMSYAQLAEIRGITKKAAQRLTLRHRWRRQPANDGGVLVWVPDDAASSGRQAGGQTDRHDRGSDGLMAGALAALEAALTEANRRADSAFALAERTLSQFADANARAERAEDATEAQRRRANALQADLAAANTLQVETEAAMQARIQAAQDALAALRKAETDRKARGLLARLRAAWRGE